MSKSKAIAQTILDTAKQLGWTVTVRGSVLTAQKTFTPGDKDGFVEADASYDDIIGLLPQTGPGSVWGADGGSVGAISAMQHGLFTINKTGGEKRVLAALSRLLEAEMKKPVAATKGGIVFKRNDGAIAVTKAGTVVASIIKSVAGMPGHNPYEPWLLVYPSGRIDRHPTLADTKNDALKI